MNAKKDVNRREFIKKTAASGIALSIIPSHVLGGSGKVAPSDRLNIALMGCGMMGLGALNGYLQDPGYQFTSVCDPETDSNKYPGRPGWEI